MRGEKRGYLGGNGDVTEALLISQVLERGDHVSLEVVPAEAELLVVRHFGQEVVWLCNRCRHLNTWWQEQRTSNLYIQITNISSAHRLNV